MNARTGSPPWDLTGRTLTPKQLKEFLEKLAREQEQARKDGETKA